MQTKPHYFAAAALGASLFLSACNKPETIVANGPADPDAAALNAAAPVALPPMVIQSHAYRCKDNRLVYVDFFSNNTANYKTTKEGTAVVLTAPEAGKPYTADGYSVSGDGPTVQIAAPGKPSQSCKA
jgi:hypothetical protein